ncbi:MAG: hypothetical protein JNL64_11915 [Blastocatellia bacterium]|nr:hypothetical protein [Blastocatellia bacterium]
MRSRLLISVIGLTIVLVASPVLAKPWKGISPLKTTRGEVVKLLGQPIGIDEEQRAVFSHIDGQVKISWKRPDCASKDLLWSEKEADDKALVYQITVEPKSFYRSIDDYEKPEPPPSPSEKEDIKTTYKRYLEHDVSCLMGSGISSCTITNSRTGFGYSDSTKLGVTSIYYFPSKTETDLFLSKVKPCSTDTIAN